MNPKRGALAKASLPKTGLARAGPAKSSLAKTGLALVVPLAVLTVWQTLAMAGLLNHLFFPAPTRLAAAAWEMARSGEIEAQTRVTLGRTLIGFATGSLAGLICGLLMGGVTVIRHALEPVVSAIYSTPKLSLLPMLMLFFGAGDTARIVLIAAVAFILMAIHGLDAVRSVNHAYVELAANYGANRLAIFRRVYVPASLPQIFTGLRLALGQALVIAVAVEMVSASDGLGSMIWLSWQTFATEKLYIGVFVTAALGMTFHVALRRLEARWIPWGKQIERAQ